MPSEYNIGSGMSEGQLKVASFWVRHGLWLKKAGYGALIALVAATWAWSLWGLIDAYIISYPREARITQIVAQNQVTIQGLATSSPQPIQSTAATVLPTTDARSDMFVELTNPNTQWWAEFTYHFNVNGQATPDHQGFILPQDQRYLSELGWNGNGRGIATLEVTNVRWHRIDPAQVERDYGAFRDQRMQLTFRDVAYKHDLTIGTQTVGQTSFTLDNPSGYGFWTVDLTVVLFRGTTPVGITQVTERDIKPGESRPITINWFDNIAGVTKTDIRPSVNILDPSAYLPTGQF